SGEGGVVSIFARKMHRQEPVTVFGDGLQTRDFVYVGDIAAANVQAINSQDLDRILNISTQTEISVNQLASLFAEVSGRENPITYQPAREGDIVRSMLRNTAARSILNWMPSTSLREGLDRTYRAFTD
ncbi:MAG: UDP-glucose 4-epimerase, partial [Firmicutes bacterium]|nr:UDP-glucose 4-epimerase [Bacillota bacterium]